MGRYCLEWSSLRAVEPSLEEVQASAGRLSAWYNEPTNRALMTSETELSAEEVVQRYRDLWSSGDRPFLFYSGDELVGDCDLRNIEAGQAEYAVMIGPREQQGKDLGTKFSAMVLAFAFGPLGLRRVFVSVVLENPASLRMFEKLGFRADESPEARATRTPRPTCVFRSTTLQPSGASACAALQSKNLPRGGLVSDAAGSIWRRDLQHVLATTASGSGSHAARPARRGGR